MTSWSSIRSSWDAGWVSLEQQAVKTYGRAITAEPLRYAGQVESFIRVLEATKGHLTASHARLAQLQAHAPEAHGEFLSRYVALQARYNGIAAGLWANSTIAETTTAPETGAVPALAVVAVVLGVGLTATGIAWAVAYREYAVALKKDTELFAAELAAREAASREGRTLPPATIPRQPQPAPPGAGGSGSTLLLGGLLVAAVVGGGVLYLRTR